jgi:hypothetical protein
VYTLGLSFQKASSLLLKALKCIVPCRHVLVVVCLLCVLVVSVLSLAGVFRYELLVFTQYRTT